MNYVTSPRRGARSRAGVLIVSVSKNAPAREGGGIYD